jgi:hypothetical protein
MRFSASFPDGNGFVGIFPTMAPTVVSMRSNQALLFVSERHQRKTSSTRFRE